MKKDILIKTIFIIIAMLIIMLLMSIKANAVSLSITPSKKTVAPNETFTVTVTLKDGAGSITAGGRTEWLDNSSFTYSVTAGASGSVDLRASGVAADYKTEADTPVTASASVKIASNGPNNGGSTNNGGNTNTGNGGTTDSAPTLSNLGIRPNDFSGFKPGKKEYSVTVPADCTSIEVYASSKNGTVSGTGTKTLKNGTNRFDVTVTNGSKKTTYTILVTKKSDEDGETPPNTIDEENPDETIQEGIGLASLEIEGYTLDKEFKTDVYEYTVKVNKQLTLEDLEAIKEKVKAVANTENVTVDIATNVSEDKVSTIVITVKDEEKEYAKYVVTFEVKKENTKVAGIIKNNSNSPTIGMFGLTEEQQIYAILGGIGITTFLAIVFACVSYAKSRRIAEYEEEDDEYEEENSDFEKMNQYYIGMENAKTEEEPTLDRSSEITSEPSIAETIEDTATSLRKTNGYRKLSRGRRSYGKH